MHTKSQRSDFKFEPRIYEPTAKISPKSKIDPSRFRPDMKKIRFLLFFLRKTTQKIAIFEDENFAKNRPSFLFFDGVD